MINKEHKDKITKALRMKEGLTYVIMKEFIKLLYKHGAFHSYMKNLDYDKRTHPFETMSVIYKSMCIFKTEVFVSPSFFLYAKRLFTNAFEWKNTSEGYGYWSDLDNEWCKILPKIIKHGRDWEQI